MRLKPKFFLLSLFLVALCLIGYRVIFTTTSVKVDRTRETIFVDSSSPVSVRVVAINRLGMRVPFKHLKGRFVVREGAEKITIIGTREDELIFKTNSLSGRLEILYYTGVIPFPVEIVFNIESESIADLMNLNVVLS